MPADPKPAARIVDKQAWRKALEQEPWCVICEERRSESAHHLLKRSQGGDDVAANLVGLCGSGTTGCHGRVEAEDPVARKMLGEYVCDERGYFIEYLILKMGVEPAASWLRRRLLCEGVVVDYHLEPGIVIIR